MASVQQQIAIAFAPQATLGTIDPTLAAAVSPLNLASGLILGATGSGVKDSGISFSESRVLREQPPVAAGFTKNASIFLRSEPATFTFSFPLAGNRVDVGGTITDSDFTHEKGIDALLKCCGFAGAAWGAGNGWVYNPASLSTRQASCVIWVNGYKYLIKDVFGDSLEFNLTPGEIGICTATLTGIIDDFQIAVFPASIDYEEQAAISAPVIESVGNAWDVTKPFNALTVTVNNELTDVPDSNAEGGSRKRQTGRTVSISGTFQSDDSNIDFEREKLVGTTAPTQDITFTVGTAATINTNAVAYYMALNNVEVREIEESIAGSEHARVISAICTATTEGGELELRFI